MEKPTVPLFLQGKKLSFNEVNGLGSNEVLENEELLQHHWYPESLLWILDCLTRNKRKKKIKLTIR